MPFKMWIGLAVLALILMAVSPLLGLTAILFMFFCSCYPDVVKSWFTKN